MLGEELASRVAVVTGASRGIGRAIAERLASAGATVVLAARSVTGPTEDLQGTTEEGVALILSRGGKAISLPCDIESDSSREALIAEVVSRFGRIDILVNNAGRAVLEPVESMTLAASRMQTEHYLFAPLHLSLLAVEHMKAQGEGWIVNLGSRSVLPIDPPYEDKLQAERGLAFYGAVKAAVHRLTVGLAIELLAHNVAVNVVAPVMAIATPGTESLGLVTPELAPYFEKIEHIAEATVALCIKPPRERTGVTAYSYEYLDQIERSTHSLDGKDVITARGSASAGSS